MRVEGIPAVVRLRSRSFPYYIPDNIQVSRARAMGVLPFPMPTGQANEVRNLRSAAARHGPLCQLANRSLSFCDSYIGTLKRRAGARDGVRRDDGRCA